jgi:hypothetical protein
MKEMTMRFIGTRVSTGLIALALAAACSSGRAPASSTSNAQSNGGDQGNNGLSPSCKPPKLGPLNGGQASGSEINPAPASIGADVPATYFGPAPSSVNPKLVGPVQLLKAGAVDSDKGTVTLPLYKGKLGPTGQSVWFVLTDTDDKENADALGLNFSAKLAYAFSPGKKATRTGTVASDGTVTFDQGSVDFSPERALVAGTPSPFPPASATPGSKGNADYSPLVKLSNAGGHTYNAPVIAFDVADDTLAGFCNNPPDYHLVHDKVVSICRGPGKTDNFTVTLALTNGFSFGRPVMYLSTEASDATTATLEGATFAPGLADIVVGRDDSAFSAIERLFAIANGPQNLSATEVNPQRQGLNSAIVDGHGPLNVLGGIPTVATDYSPIWDVNLGVWTADAIAKGYRSRVDEEFQILGLASRGFLTGPGGTPFGSTGIVVNCPIVKRLL